jgi:hypothetical protein
MAFQKGQGGRPAGAGNKATTAVRQVYEGILENNSDKIQYALDTLYDRQPAKFLDVMIKLSEFVIPKMRSVEGSVELGDNAISKITVELKQRDNGRGTNNTSN